ncbi:lipopolysaccharide biosynthesis protein [Flavihumibacter sp. R14]|nr:lipopolysaccharide biosynthesis protein [Flavihumibacter soli]
MSLRKKTISGMIWTFGQQFSVQFIGFFVSIILARLLSPAEFGLIGMLSIVITVGRNLMDSGLTSSIVRTEKADNRDFSTVFIINLIGSVIIYIIIFLIAPFIGAFYKQEILISIIRVYSLTIIFQAFMSVQNAVLTRELNFKAMMVIQIPSVLIGGIIGIVLAYYGFGVWSLVYMYVCQSLISSMQHWIYSSWRPTWIFDKSRFKSHFNFGYKITLAGLLESIYQNLYVIIIGKYFSATQLGYYNRAFSLRQLPISNISAAIGKVTYPILSSISGDDAKLRGYYQKLIQQITFWIAPMMIISIILAEPLFRFLLTEKWLPAVPYFQILCITGIIYPLQAYNYNIIKVKGRTDLTLKIQIVKKVYAIIGIFCALSFGIYGLLIFQLLAAVIDYSIDCFFSKKLIDYSISNQLRDIAPSIFIASVVGLMIWFLDQSVFLAYKFSDLNRLAIGMLLYFVSYLTISHFLQLSAAKDIKELIFRR